MTWDLLLISITFILLVKYVFERTVKPKQVSLPPTAIVIAAYLNNELTVIEKSIQSFEKVRGISSIHLAWNGPVPEDSSVLHRLQTSTAVKSHYFPDSQSKAENLNRVLPILKEDFVIICDADDILYPHALETLFSKMSNQPNVLCVQGRFKIRNSGNILVWAADLIEQTTMLCLTSILCDFFIFKGHNGLWRKSFLLHGFDTDALTEDFEISIRAQQRGDIRMSGITGECLAAPTWKAYLTQRARWFHGGFHQWKSIYGLMFAFWFGVLFIAMWKRTWTPFLFTFLLTESFSDSLAASVGMYMYVLSLPVTILFTLKRIWFRDQNWNVTPRNLHSSTSRPILTRSQSRSWTRR